MLLVALVWVFFSWLDEWTLIWRLFFLSWMSGDSSENCPKEKMLSCAEVILLLNTSVNGSPPLPVFQRSGHGRRQLVKNKAASNKTQPPVLATTRGGSVWCSSLPSQGQQKPKEMLRQSQIPSIAPLLPSLGTGNFAFCIFVAFWKRHK